MNRRHGLGGGREFARGDIHRLRCGGETKFWNARAPVESGAVRARRTAQHPVPEKWIAIRFTRHRTCNREEDCCQRNAHKFRQVRSPVEGTTLFESQDFVSIVRSRR